MDVWLTALKANSEIMTKPLLFFRFLQNYYKSRNKNQLKTWSSNSSLVRKKIFLSKKILGLSPDSTFFSPQNSLQRRHNFAVFVN